MKKITFIALVVFSLIGNTFNAISQNTVTVSGSSAWVGYANVFGLDGTSYEFGSGWGLADVKSVVNIGTNSVTLYPNFNTYANAVTPTDIAYWRNGSIGNKIFEGNTFVENAALAGQVLTFSGNVVSNTLASGYTAVAFIKGLNPATGYSADVNVSVPLVSGQAFTVTTTTAIPAGLIVQYGFTIKGLNGNPANEVALGNVVVGPSTSGSTPLTQMSLPVTFDDETVEYGLIGFGGADDSSVVVDPTLSSNKVVKVVKSAGAETWAGTTVTAAAQLGFSSPIPFTVADTKMNVRVWSPNAGIQVRLKVEDHANNGITCESEATVTTASGWQTLEFNFANQVAGSAALDVTKNYDKASIFFNFGVTGATAGEKTYYFDDVKFGAFTSTPVELTQMNLPVTFDETTVDYGLIGFGGAEASSVVVDPTLSSNKVVKVIKSATAELWAGTTVTAAAELGFLTKIPFTVTDTKMNVRVWSPNAGIQVRLKVEDHANNGITCESEATVTTASGWQTLEFNFANQVAGSAALDVTKNYDKASIFFNFGVTGATAGEKTYYFDDVKFGAFTSTPVELTQMNLPVTFDETTVDYGLIGFGGAEASSVVVDPTLSSNKVVKVIKSATAELWAGTTVTAAAELGFLTKIPFTVTDTKMNVRVWSPNAGIQVRLKVEDHANNGITCETEATVTTASGWQTLEFNFANPASGTAAFDPTKNYDKASIFFNFGVTGATAGEKTYYFDDVKFGAAPVETVGLALPIDFESSTITYAFTDFDGGAATKIVNPQSSGINTSATVAQMVKGAGAAWAGSYITMPSAIDFSTKKIFKVKVWSPVAGKKLLLKFEGAGAAFEKLSSAITAANTWEELTFDFTGLSVNNLNNKIVLIFDLGTVGDGSANSTYLIDDITQSAASGPVSDPITLPLTFESSTVNYSFIDFDGGAVTKIANPQSSGANTSATVAQMVKGAGAGWAGSKIIMASPIDFSVNKIFKVKVWSPVAGKKLLLKFEGAGAPFELESAPIATANTWQELTFDYTSVGGVNNLNNQIVFIFDLGTAGDGSANSTYLFDDVIQTNTLSVAKFETASVKMYPNPVKSTLTIDANSTIEKVAVYNLLGQEVLVRNPKSNSTTLQTGGLQKGVYIVRTNVDGNVTTSKIIKD
ncbi:MAG: T9SS type A sorting domain-containing protein [Flavobacterium sp.]|nr:T9SS type A sorting domain-containing protein [Flavobacterium sp.]